MNGDQDTSAPVAGIRVIESVVRRTYAPYGQKHEFQSVVYPGQGYVYMPAMWAKTLSWMDEPLKK